MSVLSQFFSGANTNIAMVPIELLMVGGGAGGGGCTDNQAPGFGGGAGEVIYSSKYNVIIGKQYTIAIGSGGAGGPGPAPRATQGGNTVFGTLTAYGGGGNNTINPISSSYRGSTPGYFNGGSAIYINAYEYDPIPFSVENGSSYKSKGTVNSTGAGAGGGGASGIIARYYEGGWPIPTPDFTKYEGQDGLYFTISGISTAYGGGGAAGSGTALGIGGTGGGGSNSGAALSGNGGNGDANTGGGGGGAYNSLGSPFPYSGGSGGSGVLFIRYPTAYAAATVSGNTPTPAQPGYNVYRWNTGPGSITFNA